MNRQETFISHMCAPLSGKGNSLYRHGVENILGRREAPRGLHVVIMPAKQKVRAEVEILLPAVARDVWWVRYTEGLATIHHLRATVLFSQRRNPASQSGTALSGMSKEHSR